MTSADRKHEGKDRPIPQSSDSLGAKLADLEKLLQSSKSRSALAKAIPKDVTDLLAKALLSDEHWRDAIGCMSYFDRAHAAKLWSSFDVDVTALRSEEIFENSVPPQTKLALGAIVRSQDPALSARLLCSALEGWTPGEATTRTSTSVAHAIDQSYFRDKQWTALPLDPEAASRFLPRLIEALTSLPAQRKMKSSLVREFAMWAAAELKNANVDPGQRRELLARVFTLASTFEDAWKQDAHLAAGVEEIRAPAAESAAQSARQTGDDPAANGSGIATPPEDAIIDDAAQKAESPAEVVVTDEIGDSKDSDSAPTEPQEHVTAKSEVHDLRLVRQALELADDIRAEIDRRRREETTIRALASELTRSLVAFQDAEREITQLKKDFRAATAQKQRALGDLKTERTTSATLRENLDASRAEVADKKKQIDDLHETLAAAQKEHDFRIDNQVPLRIQEAKDRLGSQIASVFDNVRSADGDELNADHAVVLRELFRRLEKLLNEQGVPV
jgi:hypothetical protein